MTSVVMREEHGGSVTPNKPHLQQGFSAVADEQGGLYMQQESGDGALTVLRQCFVALTHPRSKAQGTVALVYPMSNRARGRQRARGLSGSH